MYTSPSGGRAASMFDPLTILEKHGWQGLAAFIAWRVLAWLGSRGNDLVQMHRKHLAANVKQLRRQSLLIRGLLEVMKENGAVLRDVQANLQKGVERGKEPETEEAKQAETRPKVPAIAPGHFAIAAT